MRLITSLLLMPLVGVLGQHPLGFATWKKRLTGGDLDTSQRWGVAGTDLGIPYLLENEESVGYLFGDTFSTQSPDPGVSRDWRSPVLLRSAIHPGDADGIVFDSAAGIAGDQMAPEIVWNGHNGDDGAGTWEFTVIPNDGISFPETGQQIISYMSIKQWDPAPWSTNYAGIAISNDGNTYERLPTVFWNNDDNTDPFQMWTMQRHDEYVYIFSVRSGRQPGPMMLRRVKWDQMTDVNAYESWGHDGNEWAWNNPATPILEGTFGEPSVRKLEDGTWAMTYLDLGDIPKIVSRTAKGPDQVWSEPKIQLTAAEEPNLYGGFIHPWSTTEPNGLHMIVSRWSRDMNGVTTHYHASQYIGTL